MISSSSSSNGALLHAKRTNEFEKLAFNKK